MILIMNYGLEGNCKAAIRGFGMFHVCAISNVRNIFY